MKWRILSSSCSLGSGELEFPEFCTLAAQFLIEEDSEQMQKELKEAFRLYDKEGSLWQVEWMNEPKRCIHR